MMGGGGCGTVRNTRIETGRLPGGAPEASFCRLW